MRTLEQVIAESIVLIIGTKNYLKDLRNRDARIVKQKRIARRLHRPIIILLHKDLSQDEIIELESYFHGDNVIKEIEVDLDNEDSMIAAFKELEACL